jgi:hypothetical protein
MSGRGERQKHVLGLDLGQAADSGTAGVSSHSLLKRSRGDRVLNCGIVRNQDRGRRLLRRPIRQWPPPHRLRPGD